MRWRLLAGQDGPYFREQALEIGGEIRQRKTEPHAGPIQDIAHFRPQPLNPRQQFAVKRQLRPMRVGQFFRTLYFDGHVVPRPELRGAVRPLFEQIRFAGQVTVPERAVADEFRAGAHQFQGLPTPLRRRPTADFDRFQIFQRLLFVQQALFQQQFGKPSATAFAAGTAKNVPIGPMGAGEILIEYGTGDERGPF